MFIQTHWRKPESFLHLTSSLHSYIKQMNCQNSQMKNPRLKAPSNLGKFWHVNTRQSDWCSSDAQCQSSAHCWLRWCRYSLQQSHKSNWKSIKNNNNLMWREPQLQLQQERGQRSQLLQKHPSAQHSFPPPTKVCRCYNGSSQQSWVTLWHFQGRKRTTTEDWRHLLQERWRRWGYGDAHWIKKPLAMFWATVG